MHLGPGCTLIIIYSETQDMSIHKTVKDCPSVENFSHFSSQAAGTI